MLAACHWLGHVGQRRLGAGHPRHRCLGPGHPRHGGFPRRTHPRQAGSTHTRQNWPCLSSRACTVAGSRIWFVFRSSLRHRLHAFADKRPPLISRKNPGPSLGCPVVWVWRQSPRNILPILHIQGQRLRLPRRGSREFAGEPPATGSSDSVVAAGRVASLRPQRRG